MSLSSAGPQALLESIWFGGRSSGWRMRFWFVLCCHYLSGFGQVSTFLACPFYKVLARTVVLNAHAYCCTLSNTLTFFEECFGSGSELKVWRPTPESSILSVRCVRIGVVRQNSDL